MNYAVLNITCDTQVPPDNRWIIAEYSDGTQRLIYLNEGVNSIEVPCTRDYFMLHAAPGCSICIPGADEVCKKMPLLPIDYHFIIEK